MATNITSTELDFNRIKEQLKTHFLSSDEFADYDFEASGLSNILDVLAYNTHYNGLIANFALNEAFLPSAQLRSSVLAISESLGYTPRSKTTARATVNLSVTVSDPNRPGLITLPSGTSFTATVEDVAYVFQTAEDVVGYDDGAGVYQFLTSTGSSSISIYEGEYKTKTFISDSTTNPVYVIPDEFIDTSTATVQVYPTRNSEFFEVYLPLASAQTVTAATRYYSLRESPNGYYELIFGDGITTGKAPAPGEVIQVRYIRTSSSAANTASVFTAQDEITVDDIDYSINVTTVARASGGADKESLESIKANAPISYAAQNRLVTAQDYVALINRNYGTYLDDVTAWGGEDNIPASFGNVYVALKYKEETSEAVKQVVQDSIISNLSDNLSIMSIDTKFAETITTYIETSTFFNFDPSLTSTTLNTTESQVQSAIALYFTDNLNRFNSIFRRSQVLTAIDDLNPAILDSRIDVKVQMRVTPILNKALNYTLQFPVSLQSPNVSNYSVTSSAFYYNGQVCRIRNRINSNVLQIVSSSGDIIVTSIGSYNALNGSINLVAFKPTSIISAESFIKISAVPENQATIRPLRNYVFVQDTTASFASGVIDYQEIKATL